MTLFYKKLPILLLSGLAATSVLAKAPNAPSEEILSKPMFTEKLVIAHNMTQFIHSSKMGSTAIDWLNPKEHYYPDGESKAIKGTQLYATMLSMLEQDQSLEEAVEFEMKAAMELGIDGFQFFYPGVGPDKFLDLVDKIILAYIKVAEEKGIDFKISLSICNPDWAPFRKNAEDGSKFMVERLGKRINDLLSSTRDSEKWLRTPDGRLVSFIWVPESILLSRSHFESYEDPEINDKVAELYYQIAEMAGEPEMAYVYHLQSHRNKDYTDKILENYPAVWDWTTGARDADKWIELAKEMDEMGRTYTQTVYPSYFTSKAYDKKTKRPILAPEKLAVTSPDTLLRHGHVTRLSTIYRELLQRAVDTDTKLINFVTWNDYPEGHHLAPEVNHNFGYAELLKYYKRVWKTGEKIPKKDSAIVFYKKYPSNVVPEMNIDMHYKEKLGDISLDDDVEVVTLLTADADVYYNGKKIGTGKAGINIHYAPMEIGSVNIEVKRDDKSIFELKPPISITDKPFRTDRVTVTYSSEFDKYYSKLFGNIDKKLPKPLNP